MILHLTSYPSMKDSGAPWLDKVPAHWDVQPISRIGTLLKGRGGSKEDEEPSGIPCVRYGDLYTRHEFFITSSKGFVSADRARAYTPIQYGDVLFAGSGETIEDIGRSAVSLLEGNAVCGGDVILLRPNRDINPRFLGYAADAPASRHQKATMGRGFTVVHIYGSELKRLAVAIPPHDEQAAIVRFLDHTDRRIRLYIRAKQKLIKLLEEQKQAIIHRAVTRGLDPSVRLRPSGVRWLGDVPQHWEVKRLRHISPRITVGLVINPSTYFIEGSLSDGVAMLLGNNVIPGGFKLQQVRRISLASNKKLQASRLDVGDVVVVRVGAPGVAAVVPPELDQSNCASVMIVRRSTSYISEWLAFVFNSPMVRNQVNVVKYGAAQKQFNISHALDFWFSVPPREEQSRIVEYLQKAVTPSDSAIQNASQEIELIREYRARLIADVVTGKLDVREAAARLPDDVEEPDRGDKVYTEADVEESSDDVDAVAAEAEA